MSSLVPDHLQFKPWLVQQISSGDFKDLEWIDANQQRVFKLPWTKKNYPNWEEHHEIFRAWARHRSNVRHDPEVMNQHISLMKSNFRTILRKCNEIEELKNFHQLGLQTGNYKVYRVLTPEEVQLKKSLPSTTGDAIEMGTDIVEISSTAGIDNINWLQDVTIPKAWIDASSTLGIAILEGDKSLPPLSKRPLSPEPELRVALPKAKVKKTQATQTAAKDPLFKAKEVIFLSDPVVSHVVPDPLRDEPPLVVEVDNVIGQSEEVVEIKSEAMEGSLEVSQENNEGFHMLLEAAEIAETGVTVTVNEEGETTMMELSILDVLDKLNIPRELLYTYEVEFKYEQKQVSSSVYRNMDQGYRFHYDSDEEGGELLSESDFLESIRLPQPSAGAGGKSFQTVFRNMNLGFILKADEFYGLTGKRLCQSRVFALTSYGDQQSTEPLAVAKGEEVALFSYSTFLQEWYQSLINKQPQPKIDIEVSFGRKPKRRNGKVFVGMQIIPKAAEAMLEFVASLPTKMLDTKMIKDSKSQSRTPFDQVMQIWY